MAEGDIWRGVLAGVSRFARDVNDVSHQDVTEGDQQAIYKQAMKYAERIEQWHPRAQRLFVEILTIGELSRTVRKRRDREEPDLNDDEVIKFIGDLDIMFNSWKRTDFPN
jgi:hypothetical protein